MLSVVSSLIEHGISLDSDAVCHDSIHAHSYSQGRHAILEAVGNGNIELTTLFFDNGVDMDARYAVLTLDTST